MNHHQDNRSDWTAAAPNRDNKTDLRRNHRTATATTDQRTTNERIFSPGPDADRTIPSSTPRAEARAQGERTLKRARGMALKPNVVPEQSKVPEPRVLPEPEDVPIPDADDLVIGILTDQMINFDDSSTEVLEIFAVTSRDKKRVEVNERKMTNEDRKLFRRAKDADLQSYHKVLDVVNKKVADKDRVMRTRWVLTWKSTNKAKARLCVLGFQDPDLTEVPRDSTALSAQAEALTSQCVASNQRKLVSRDIKTAFLSEDEEHPKHLHPTSR